jgi:Spy/CpxP family protein refolding chaperone
MLEDQMKKSVIVMLAAMFTIVGVSCFAGEVPSLPPGPHGGPQAFAAFAGPMGPPGFGYPPEPFLDAGRLNLTKEQQAKMADIRRRTGQEMRGLEYRLAHKRLEMQELFADPKATEASLLAKLNELNALRSKLDSRRAEAIVKMRSVLTAEQIGRLDRVPPPPPPPRRDSMREREGRPCPPEE